MIGSSSLLPEAFVIKGEGIGDLVQFTSLPENYYRQTGKKLVDVEKRWAFDHNPYVLRNVEQVGKVHHLWNYFCPSDMLKDPLPRVRGTCYMTNAEIHLATVGYQNPHLIRPKLYQYDSISKYMAREDILFHPFGKSHGALSKKVIDHVLDQYGWTGNLLQIGLSTDPDLGIRRLFTKDAWDLAKHISRAKMLIGVDSGPAWIAACYPDVIVKKIRVGFQDNLFDPKDWVPLSEKNPHSIWDDRTLFKMYWCGEDDVSFMESYRKI